MVKYILKKIYYFFSFILLLILFLIQKIILIRIGYYFRDKIGHLIGNTQIYFYKKKLTKKFNLTKNSLIEIDLWITGNKSIYPIIDNYYKKKLILLPQFLFIGVYNLSNKYPFFKKFTIDEHDWGMDFYNLTYKDKPKNIINAKQVKYAKEKLKKISIYPKHKIACIINRNNFFNKKITKNSNLIKINEYRNSDFNDYLPAAKYLVKKGYKVIRMGSHDKNFQNKYVTNYSSSKIKDFIIDLYLLKKADLIITSGTGIDLAASHFFKKSICCVNLIPHLNIQSFKFSPKGVFLTKKLYKNEKLLSLKKIIKGGLFYKGRSSEYKNHGIKIVNNSRKEILECVKEFYKIKFENYKYKKKELSIQKKFYKVLNRELLENKDYENHLGSHNDVKLSLKQKPSANFSLFFLKNNPKFLKD